MVKIRSGLFRVWKEREIALGRSLTYREVAEQTRVSTSTLYNYRHGDVLRFEATTLAALCGFFECEPCDLIIAVPNGGPGTDAP